MKCIIRQSTYREYESPSEFLEGTNYGARWISSPISTPHLSIVQEINVQTFGSISNRSIAREEIPDGPKQAPRSHNLSRWGFRCSTFERERSASTYIWGLGNTHFTFLGVPSQNILAWTQRHCAQSVLTCWRHERIYCRSASKNACVVVQLWSIAFTATRSKNPSCNRRWDSQFAG